MEDDYNVDGQAELCTNDISDENMKTILDILNEPLKNHYPLKIVEEINRNSIKRELKQQLKELNQETNKCNQKKE